MEQDFIESLKILIRSQINNYVHTSSAGTIGSSSGSSASVKPNCKLKTPDGKTYPYPRVSGAKVVMPMGKGGTIGFAFPVSSGDGCLTVYGEGGTGTDMKFDLGNAICVPGLLNGVSAAASKAAALGAAIMFTPNSEILASKDKISITHKDKYRIYIDDAKIEVAFGDDISLVMQDVDCILKFGDNVKISLKADEVLAQMSETVKMLLNANEATVQISDEAKVSITPERVTAQLGASNALSIANGSGELKCGDSAKISVSSGNAEVTCNGTKISMQDSSALVECAGTQLNVKPDGVFIEGNLTVSGSISGG